MNMKYTALYISLIVGVNYGFSVVPLVALPGGEIMNAVCDPLPMARLHMMRGMDLAGSFYPFHSLDSTNIAQNYKRGKDITTMATRLDSLQNPGAWTQRPEQQRMAV